MKNTGIFLGLGLFGILLCGCNSGSQSNQNNTTNNEDVHEHAFSSEWSFDQEYHWHKATCEHTEEVKDKSEHTFGEWTVDVNATEYELGSKHRVCDICGYRVDETIDKLDHTHKPDDPVIENKINETCTEAGSYDLVTYCKECGEELTREHKTIDAHGHDYHSVIVNPTFESTGKIIYTCDICGDIYEETGEPKLSHNYSTEWSIDETKCTHYHACIDEGYEALRSSEAAHTPGEWITTKEATDFVDGEQSTNCTVCGAPMTKAIDCYEEYCKKNLLNFSYMKISGWNRYGYVVTGVTNKNVERLIIPTYYGSENTPVKSIYSNALANMPNLKELVIDASIYEIGSYAVSNCPKLETVRFSFGSGGLFAFNSYIINYEESVIRQKAFANCSSLTKISIPTYFGTFEAGIFFGCSSLEELELPFVGLSRTGNVLDKHFGRIFGSTQFDNTVSFITFAGSTTCIYYIPSTLKKVVITGGELAKDSFSRIPVVEQLYLGEYITLISQSCAYLCPDLKYIKVSANTDWISNYAFYKNSSLETVEIDGNIEHLGSSVFAECPSLKTVTLPATLLDMSTKVFLNCESLVSVNIPENIKVIDHYTFMNCKSLSSISIPNNVKTIGGHSFANCISLETILLPDSVTSIGDNAFDGCTSLVSINIPDNIRGIASSVFSGCISLTSIIIPESLISISSDVFSGCTSLQYNHYENGSYLGSPSNPYFLLVGPSDIAIESCVIHKDCSLIPPYAFSECTSLTSAEFEEGLTRISIMAFIRCTSLESVTIPNTVTLIEMGAFQQCTSLRTINFNGTKAEWNNVEKRVDWNKDVPTKIIHCLDGNVAVS